MSIFGAPADWSADDVIMHNCGPQGDVNVYDLAPTDTINFWQGWTNNNASTSAGEEHALIQARPVINGETVPIAGLNDPGPNERLVDSNTYELLVGPGGSINAIGCLVEAQDVPIEAPAPGETVDAEYGVNVVSIEPFQP